MEPSPPPTPNPAAHDAEPVLPPRRGDGDLGRSRAIARILDDLVPIPGTPWRVGLDPLVGLIPGVGDWIGWAASLHLVASAVRAGADAATLVRMAANVLLDAVVGAVPVLGDAFDLAWKANDRNLRLLEAVVDDPRRTRRASRGVVVGVLGGTVVLLGATSVGAVLLLRRVAEAVLGLF